MKRLGLFLILASCTNAGQGPRQDTPPDPALRDVRITYVHAPPEWIRERGFTMRLARSARDQTLAFSQLRPADRTCIVTLPYPETVGLDLYQRLRRHEERHCHGEQHHARQFRDEEPFD